MDINNQTSLSFQDSKEPIILLNQKEFKELIKKKDKKIPYSGNFFDISINNFIV